MLRDYDIEAVMATIQTTYGDATQTALDRRAAVAILEALEERGWTSLQDVGALIAASGGQIVLTPSHKMAALDGRYEVSVMQDHLGNLVVRSRLVGDPHS